MAKVDLNSAYSKLLYEYEQESESVTDWENALLNLTTATSQYESDISKTQQQYQQELSMLKQQSNYDISQAYANYKRTQLQLLQNTQLGSGLRESLSSELSGAYSSEYSGIAANAAIKQSNLKSAYTSQYNKLISDYASKYSKYTKEAQEALDKEVSMLTNLDRAVLEFNEIGSFAEAEKQGYYVKQQLTAEETKELKTLVDKTTMTSEEQKRYNELVGKQNEYVLTDKGKDLYSKTYLSTFTDDDDSQYTFADWLRNNETYGEEVSDYYLSNRSKIGELTAGFSAEEMGGTYDPLKYEASVISPQVLSSQTNRFEPNNNPYGINKEAAKKAFSAADLSSKSFENAGFSMKGQDDSNSDQAKWFETLKQGVKDGTLKDGAIVDMNYGAGKKRNYVLYRGYWYPTDLPAKYKDPKDTDGKIEKK